ncbi:GNAT family N-acetyltransferase [Psychrobacter sp. ER1]|uniref:GNAT family N-acetyltransferase n=1 Tax=Psychrobacter sp. ER1 TaxID=3406645 RepID=UPI003B4393A8
MAGAKRKTVNFDSELQFFCVDPNYRRHRIGAMLIQAFETYLVAQGADTYALHTDTLCTYQYYDNNGYQHVDEYPNHLNPQIMHYTYVKSLS